MNNNNTLSQELEIDLIQVMKDLLLQWKAIIVVMLIFGLATPGVMYMREMKAYNAAVTAKKELEEKAKNASSSENVDVDSLFENMEESEKNAVDSALIQYGIFEKKKEYMSESLLMNMDPENMRCMEYIYTVGGSAQNLGALTDMYYLSTDDDVLIEALTDTMNKSLKTKTKPEYVRELVSIKNTTDDGKVSVGGRLIGTTEQGTIVFVIRVILPDMNADADAITSTVRKYMEGRHEFVSSKLGEHSLELASDQEITYTDTGLFTTQNNGRSELITLRTNLDAAVNALSDDQKQIYELLSQDEVEETEEAAEGEETQSDVPESIEKPGFSKKYALIGLLAGIFVYGGIYLLILILVPVIRTGLELSDMLGIKSFGCIHSETKRMGFMCDRLVFKNLYHRDKSVEELLNDTAERISIYAKYHEKNELTFISSDAESKEMIKALMDKVQKDGITVSYVDLWDGEKLTDLAEEKMSGNDNYVICMMPRATLIKDVDKMLSVASEYQKTVVGTVAM